MFFKNKYGKIPSKTLQTATSDFYSGEELARAKQQLMDDVSGMNSAMSIPHLPRRHNGDNKASRETGDIMTLFTCIDEHKLLDQLPRYVSDNPDDMPSIRLYEKDMYGIVRMISSLEEKVSEYGSMIAMLSRDLQAVQSRSLPIQSSEPRLEQPPKPQLYVSCQQQNNHLNRLGPPSLSSLSEFPPMEHSTSTTTTYQSADQPATRQGTDWATLMSTPCTVTRNRFAPLQSTGDDVEEDDPSEATGQAVFTEVRSRKPKRNHSSQQPQPAVSNTLSGRRTSERRAPTILGQSSFPGSKIAAARDIRKKAVFCVDNVNKSCTTEDIKSFVSETLSIEVLSCYTAQPRRRRREETSVDDRCAFRLCICEKDRDRLLDANAWPTSVLISDWVFKKSDGNDKRLRMDTEASTAAVPHRSTPITQDDTALKEVAAASLVCQAATDNDETVLEVELPQE